MNKYSNNLLPTDVSLKMASNLKILRKRKGFSQQELAKRSGVSLGSVKRFESTGEISLKSLLKLSHVLDRLTDFEAVFKPKEDLESVEKLFSNKTKL